MRAHPDRETLPTIDALPGLFEAGANVLGDLAQAEVRRKPLFFALLAGAILLGGATVSRHLDATGFDQCGQAYAQRAAAEQGRLEKLVSGIELDVRGNGFADAQAKLGQVRWQLEPSCKLVENAAARASWEDRVQQLTQQVNASAERDASAREAEIRRQQAE